MSDSVETPVPQASATPAGEPATPTPSPADTPSDWRGSLPENLRDHAALARYQSVETLARAHLNLERELGKVRVPLPQDDADAEAWNRWYAAAGRPEAPERYEIERPENLPPGVEYDEHSESWFRQEAHAAGLSNRQFRTLYEAYRDRIMAGNDASHAAAQQEVVRGKVELQRDWGASYGLRMQMAKAEFDALPKDVQQRMHSAGLMRNVGFIKYLAEARARVTGELQTVAPETGGASSVTPERLAAFRHEHASVLFDREHPDHEQRVAELTRMHDHLAGNFDPD